MSNITEAISPKNVYNHVKKTLENHPYPSGESTKGYAIYQPSHRIIIIIDAWGNKKQTYQDKDYVED